MYNTHEEIFTDAVLALSKRGWTRSINSFNSCQYGGIGCAIGVLAGVRYFAKNWDDNLGIISVVYHEGFSQYREIFGDTVNVQFLQYLQNAHDGGKNPETMKERFKNLVESWDLQISQEIRDLLA
jgi:hypothetical protein